MRSKIISIGNSRGIRIPKLLLEESGLLLDINIHVKKGEIRLTPARPEKKKLFETTLLSEQSLTKDWRRPEEDSAWASL